MKFQINKAPLNQLSNSISTDNNLACSGGLNNAVEHIKNRSVFRLNVLLAQGKKTGGKRNAEVAVSCPQHIFSSPSSSKTIMIIHLSTYHTLPLWKRQNRPQNLCLNGHHQKKYQFIWMHKPSRNQCNQKSGASPIQSLQQQGLLLYFVILYCRYLLFPWVHLAANPEISPLTKRQVSLSLPAVKSFSFSWDSKKFLYCQH